MQSNLRRRPARPVEGVEDGVALDDVRDGVDEVVQDEVEPQQAGRLLGNVLGEDGAAVLADGVGEIHQQRAGTGGRDRNR